jgi:type IV secretion system protein VirB10
MAVEQPLSGAGSEPDIVEDLRLHAPRAPVMRLSRKALVTLGVIGSTAVAGAVAFALSQPATGKGGNEFFQTDGQRPPEAMSRLPVDYAALAPKPSGDVPTLGPPLPGDLGRPILAAGRTDTAPVIGPGSPATSTATPGGPTPQEQAVSQERDAARTSHLFAETEGVTPSGPTEPHVTPVAEQPATASSNDVDPARLQPPASPYLVQAGAVVPAALVTGLRSDLPGQVIAQVTQNVYDSVSGSILLIPQGSKLIGVYDSQVVFGQSRVFLAWTRLTLPNGRSLDLPREPGADVGGYAGVQDSVDHHWRELLSAALLSTVLAVGTQAGASDTDSALIQALRQGAAGSLNQAGEQAVSKALSLAPTLTIRPGFPVRVLVTQDLVLEPYRGRQ